ncbi:MAG: histidine kinase [Spirosomataceae bacterium]
MENLDSQVAKRLTRYYIAALTAVGILSLSGQILVQSSFSSLLDDSRVINIAGRQRMLSQRLTKRLLLFFQHSDLRISSELSDFEPQLELWRQCHNGLRDGQLPVGKSLIHPQNSQRLNDMFVQLEPSFQALYTDFATTERAINGLQAAPSPLQDWLQQVLKHEQAFLKQMDAIVFQYDIETKQRVDRVRNIEFMITVVTFIVLFLEGLFVFRPIVTYTQAIIKRLVKSEADLQESNESLRHTQESLVKTTEEKFQLQMAEDTIRTGALLEGQERERGRISREIHDGIGQMLTALKLHTEKLGSVGFVNEKQQRNYEELRRLVSETIEATRNVSFNLMPSVLSDFGVVAALRLLCEQTQKTVGIEVKLHANLPLKRLAEPTEIGIYRITQEALTNSLKHADATQIIITLEQQGPIILLKIQDDGKGFSLRKIQAQPKQELSGNGLNNIRTRARLLGGECKILAKHGKGTQISVKLPVTETK